MIWAASSLTHPADTALEEVLSDLKRGQQAVHQWGAENRVSFDPGKEVFAVVHPRFAHGPDFKLLGAIFDTKLTMTSCIEATMRKVTPKIKALLRTRPYYSTSDLVRQYKHVRQDLRRRTLVPYTMRRRLYWNRRIVHLRISCAISNWVRDRLSWGIIWRHSACAVILRCWVSYTNACLVTPTATCAVYPGA